MVLKQTAKQQDTSQTNLKTDILLQTFAKCRWVVISVETVCHTDTDMNTETHQRYLLVSKINTLQLCYYRYLPVVLVESSC